MCAGGIYICACRGQRSTPCLSQQLFTLTFWYSFSTELGSHQFNKAGLWISSEIHLSLPYPNPPVWGIRYMPPCPNFHKDIGNPHQAALYQLSHLASSFVFCGGFLFCFVSNQSYSLVVQTGLKLTLNSWSSSLSPSTGMCYQQCWGLKPVLCAC